MSLVMLSGQQGPLRCELMPGVALASDERSVRMHFAEPRRALSCAVLNGGLCDARGFLNLRVGKHGVEGCIEDGVDESVGDSVRGCVTDIEDPVHTLQRAAAPLFGDAAAVGMMTAASMRSLRVLTQRVGAGTLAVVLTAGMENARRAGDPADYHDPATQLLPAGTINTAVVTTLALTDAALAEVLLVAAEAKAALLQELGVLSPVSGALATGTGTDAVAVFCARHTPQVRYAGKHTALGEVLARLVMDALRDSLRAQGSAAA